MANEKPPVMTSILPTLQGMVHGMGDTAGSSYSNHALSTLRQRHVIMIALGGAIGAGLFVGSSAAIAAAGPAVLVAFVAVHLVMVALVPRSLIAMIRGK